MPTPLQQSYDVPPVFGMIPNPRVSTPVYQMGTVRMDETDPDRHDLVGRYERGGLLVFRTAGAGFRQDWWEAINSLDPRSVDDLWVRKAKFWALMAPLTDENTAHPLLQLTDGDVQKAVVLKGMIIQVTDWMRTAVKKLFPRYRFVGENITWRLTVSPHEEMHYDAYGVEPDELHHVRVFMNLDTHPRVWGVGPPMTDTITNYTDRLRKHFGLNGNLFNDKASAALPWWEIPRHYLAFAPGNVWMVNTQLVAHEIVYGRRMLAMTLDVDPSSMDEPDLCYHRVVEAAVRKVSR